MCSIYIDRIVVKQVDVVLLSCPKFHSIFCTDDRPVRVHVNIDRPKVMLAVYWKLNSTLFGEKDFHVQLLRILHREMTGAVFGSKW